MSYNLMKNLVKSTMKTLVSVVFVGLAVSGVQIAKAGESTAELLRGDWSWTGYFGSYDKAKAQRGLQVYTEVCASCHALSLLPMRELTKLGYSDAEIKAFASKFDVDNGIIDGKMTKRKATPSDRLPAPFESEEAARAANNGALPPDLSLIINSRAHGRGNIITNFVEAIRAKDNASGADYVYSLLLGYGTPPADMTMGAGMNYNKVFPSGQIAMAQPLQDGQVTYSDGTKATAAQMSEDVVNFLAFVSQPNLEMQKSIGLKVMLFLLVFFLLLLANKKRIWKDIN